MKYEMAPVFDASDLLEAVKKETNLFDDIDYLASFLWNGDYMNDCFKKFYLDETIGDDLWSQQINFLVQFIKSIVPNDCEYILVDVSW